MPAYYSIVQFVPDPIVDERLNIGVLVFGEGPIRHRFLKDWYRARFFARKDIRFLVEFAKEFPEWLEREAVAGRETCGTLESRIAKLASKWINSIQVTRPRASLKAPDQLIEEIATRYLIERSLSQRGSRDKRAVVRLAYNGIRRALEGRQARDAMGFVKRNYEVMGKLDRHKFDIAATNGEILFAARALSFEVPKPQQKIQVEIDATAWAIDDVRTQHPNIPTAILILPPTGPSETYKNALRVFTELQAETVVEECHINLWSEQKARLLSELSR